MMYQKYDKENYIIGNSNINAWNAGEAAINNLGIQSNPLIFYGASGSGKTHLSRILLNQAKKDGRTVSHLSAMEFIDNLVTALFKQAEDDFRHELLDYDVLIIDDLQHFVGRIGCQGELQLIIDGRLAQGKQTVITSIEHPKTLDWKNKQLESRLFSGLNIEMKLADETMQKQILAKRLEEANVSIRSEEIAKAIESTGGNGWLIEGVAKQLINNIRQEEYSGAKNE